MCTLVVFSVRRLGTVLDYFVDKFREVKLQHEIMYLYDEVKPI